MMWSGVTHLYCKTITMDYHSQSYPSSYIIWESFPLWFESLIENYEQINIIYSSMLMPKLLQLSPTITVEV